MNHSRFLQISGFCSLLLASAAMAAGDLPIIPLPVSYEAGTGALELRSDTSISAAGEARTTAELLAKSLRASTGLPLPRRDSGGTIHLALDPGLGASLGREGYILEVRPDGASLTAADPAGLFYAGQTFRQLLPPEVFSPTRVEGIRWELPVVRITDQPRFRWRGFMIDTSRHFMPISHLRQLVDTMAAHKLNLLHLHLTDDDGWRIEIKSHPKLTEIGAWRGTKCLLPNTRKGETFERYGGFYTQEELRDLVAYAKARNIEIMPEIDLPGHSLAITTAYPETLPSKLPDTVSAQGHKANVISPAREENYEFIEDIVREVTAIFPFRFIHVGGDEVNRSLWSECPEIKAWMKDHKISNLHHAQVVFTQRLSTILGRHDKHLAGWQELADDRLPKETLVMAWLGAGAGWHAAKRGFPAVMAPGQHCYFDMPYPRAHDEPPSHWWAGPVGIDRCYGFDPLAGADLTADAHARILGVHAALWSEFVTPWKADNDWLELPDTAACADYKTWPRLSALAEVAWTPQADRSLDSFRNRLGPVHYRRLAAAGVGFRLEPPTAIVEKRLVRIKPPFPGAIVRFTTDGSDPFTSATARTWDGTEAPEARLRRKMRMRTVLNGVVSPLALGASIAPVAQWNAGDWKPGESQTVEYDLGGMIDSSGVWAIRFHKRKGPAKLVLEELTLVADGVERLTAKPSGTGAFVVLPIREWKPAGTLLVRASLRTEGDKPGASGDLLVEMVAAHSPPPMKIETAIGHYGGHALANLLDADPATYFWSNRHLEDGDRLTWILDEPLALRRIELQTGMPDGTKDQLLDAVLEVSEDGRTYEKVSGFSYGAAKAELGGRTIRSIRLRATAPTPGWAIIQDLVLVPSKSQAEGKDDPGPGA